MKRKNSSLILILLLSILLTSCQQIQPSTPTVTPEPTLTPVPEPTPTLESLGSSSNPFVFGTVSQDQNPDVISSSEEVARRLSLTSGFSVQGIVFSRYEDLLVSMVNRQTQIAWFPPFTYMLAAQNGFAQVALLSNHFGTYQYGTQFLANQTSGFYSFFDPQRNTSTSDSSVALQQLQGKKPCWVDYESASGYVVPLGYLVENSISVQEGVVAQSNTSIIRSLYIGGICDFGVTYAISGDPRTASAIQEDLDDVMEKVIILWQSPAIIPNLSLSFHPDISQPIREELITAWLVLMQTQEGAQLISSSMNYEITDLKIVDDTIYDPLRYYTSLSGVSLENLIGK